MDENKEKIGRVTVALIAGLVGFLGGFFIGLPIRKEQETAIKHAEVAKQEADKAKQKYLGESKALESAKEEIARQLKKATENYEQSKVTLREAVIAKNKAIPRLEDSANNEEQLLTQGLSEQKDFHWERRRYFGMYELAANEIAKSSIFREAGEFTKDFFRERNNKLENWRGKIRSIDTPHGGDTADISIVSEFWDFAIGFKTNKSTRLRRDTEIYRKLAKLPEGSNVVFSAEVISTDEETGIKETSWTERGNLRSPEFIVRFTAFQAL